MNPRKLVIAINEAERFLAAAKAVEFEEHQTVPLEDEQQVFTTYFTPRDNRATAAAKRASMDLTRALAQMRKSDYR
jgi:hypothetical protein